MLKLQYFLLLVMTFLEIFNKNLINTGNTRGNETANY
jgi:hypothetical protein